LGELDKLVGAAGSFAAGSFAAGSFAAKDTFCDFF
jgi:hypothetical protein